ncbi:MAG: acyl-CoA dehydrogenase [Alphaproteobacteria bacterium]|nr:acyl-CoA dehydrogenase [Alphaproteobacteria bacterium]
MPSARHTAELAPREAQGADAIARAKALAPIIRAAGPRIEAARELPSDLLAAMHDAGLFRLMLPRFLGGAELPPMYLAEVTEIIASADGSTGWCLGQGSGCAMSAAYLDEPIARQVFGPKNAVLSWGAGTAGKAVVTDGGYIVTGRWSFSSGSRHATWIGGHSLVYERDGSPRLWPGGQHADRTMLFLREQVAIEDDWRVMGLRGTGSDSYGVKEFFVPDRLTLNRDMDNERRVDSTAYIFTTTLVYAAAFAGVALGIARGALDDLHALAQHKTARGAPSSLRESPVFHTVLAELEGQYRAARAYLQQSYADVWRRAEVARKLTLDDRAELRLAATYVSNQSVDVVTRVYRAAGSTAIFEVNPFERRLRDSLAVSQQAQARATHYQTVGRHMMGLAPDSLMFM